MPFLQLRSALSASCATCDKVLKVFRTTPAAAAGSREAKSVEAGGAIPVEVEEAAWSALSILHVFYLVHVATVADADRPARLEETSTSELVTSVLHLLRKEQPQKSSFFSPSSKDRGSLSYVAHAFHLRLRGLVEAHERFLEWMRARLDAAESGVRVTVEEEDLFLTDAATFLRSLPLPNLHWGYVASPPVTTRRAPSRRSLYAQLVSANLYAISTFVEIAAAPYPPACASSSWTPCRAPCCLPQSIETSVLSLLYYLTILTVDVAERSALCCGPREGRRSTYVDKGQLMRATLVTADFHIAPMPAVRFSASLSSRAATPPLCVVLYTVLQQEGSQLLERLLRYGQCEARYQNEVADVDLMHRRLLGRHVLRRLGHIFFRPLRGDGTGAGSCTDITSKVVGDRTDAAIITWMAEILQRIVHLSYPAMGCEESRSTSQGFSDAAVDKERWPSRFEAECLAELLRLLIYQLHPDVPSRPSSGAHERNGSRSVNCRSGDSSDRISHTSTPAEGVTVVSPLPASVELFFSAIEAARAQDSAAPAFSRGREALINAHESVVSFVLRRSAQQWMEEH
ncbi:hypothetical protein JKF63_04547 [Porcisia hertigi]|uniref:Uncharacterized protein n=1 Tax=Porcisia hertigi TaxID=2761500 RepID=A0A836I4H7_9TRYP|nr:hypothetical protein JKF63_04547 [Porcisia hertigi]